MSIIVYGIPHCDTVKKARKWLEAQGIAHAFHDYKKVGADPARLAAWCDAKGWEALLNRRGTTFRKLPAAEQAVDDAAGAIALMAAHVPVIKRPVLEYPGGLLVGFDAAKWAAALV